MTVSEEIRRLAIVGMFSDDDLMNRLVLKGGNALDVVYGIAGRASFDLDFSMPGQFEPATLGEVRQRIERSLVSTFADRGYHVFDVRLAERPKQVAPHLAEFWGGYQVEFKLISRTRYTQLGADAEVLRRNAEVVAPGHRRRFKIDISKFEFCERKAERELDGYVVYVYTPEMCVFEKLLAICQQTQEYVDILGVSTRSARARDFFDIYMACESFGIDFADETNFDLLKTIFRAKRVPLALIGKIRDYREYHRPDFRAVMDTVKPGTNLRDFDFYFDYVADRCRELQALWEEDPPAV